MITVQGQSFTVNQAAATATIAVKANPSNGGNVSGGGTYPVGTNVQVSASENTGWTFAGWSDGGGQTHNVIMPASSATYTANFETVPVIITSPVITNSLLVISNLFVFVVGETNFFNVGATDPVDNNLLRYQWVFGDGATSAWSATALATHIYSSSNCGPYIAGVTVSNKYYAVSSNLPVIVACNFSAIAKLQVGLTFGKNNADSIGLTVRLGLPGLTNVNQLASVPVVVDVGDAQVPFTLRARQ